MTITDNPHIVPARLFGLPWAEALYATPGMCYRHSGMEDMRPGPVVIEEWSVVDPHSHLPEPEHILSYIAEWVADNGEVDEGFDEQVQHATSTAAAVAAAEALVDTILVFVNRRMAKDIVERHTVTWTPSGVPLLDGEPMGGRRPEATHALPVGRPRSRWLTRLAGALTRWERRIPPLLVALGLAVLTVAALAA